jgi:O-antigen ligase
MPHDARGASTPSRLEREAGLASGSPPQWTDGALVTNASSAGRGGKFIRLAYLVAGVVWLTVSLLPRGATLIYLWPWPLVLAAALIVPPGILVWRLARGEAVARLGGFADWAVLALLLAHAAAALLSPFRTASLCMLLLPLAALCLPYELQHWRRDDPEADDFVVRALAWLLVLFTTVSLVMWFAFIAVPYGVDQMWQARNPHPLGHSNYTAGVLLLLLPFGLVQVATKGSRLAWSFACAAALFCLFTTGSRAALVGLAAGGAAGGLMLVRCGWCSLRQALLLVAACCVGAVVFAAVNPRIRDLFRPVPGAVPDDSTIQRAAMRDAGRLMIVERPFLGWGPGTTPLVYPRFRRQLSGGVDTALQLHNAPLQLAADTGLLGLVALALLLGTGAWSCWRACAPVATRDALPAAAVAGVALVTYGAFAVYDFELDVPFFPVVASICLTLLFSRQTALSFLPRWPALVLLVAILGLAVGPKIPQLRSHYLLARASDALEAGDPETFDELAIRASEADRNGTGALNAIALQLGERARRAKDPGERSRLTVDAEGFFIKSLARNPGQELCETNLAWLLLPNDPARAEPLFLAAAALVPDKEGLFFGAAQARLGMGKTDAAVEGLVAECLIDPRFILSPIWIDPAYASLRAPVLVAVSARAGRLAQEASLAPWQRAELSYLAAFSNWLNGKISPAAVLPVVLTEEQHKFFGSDQPAQFLARLAAAQPDDLVHFRAQRPGYGVLMRNLDAPMPVDFYESYHYRVVVDSAGFLLPERLNLPGQVLLDQVGPTNFASP